ncbi:proprotein convertase P-domain-containing protein [Psychromonas sp. Urea-02u-13]|uniref:proprotein convertase P-domain-containing protein n=1 Tax=Psychromonas sp. Urea-02u-13 TaxID=2058326 RepID=UPI000C335EB0|nr:proprotein convertase P-domain-containing protein [Psychromonas sp. Urea-02u-13]PKG37892.1 propeptide, peptidase [Psychromonas sp. Urea-02u-13]
MKPQLTMFALLIISAFAQGGEWEHPAGNEIVADLVAAKSYIETHYPDIGSVALRYESESKLGHQYNFNITLNGEYKAQRTIVLHTDNLGIVQRVFKSLEDTILRDGVAITATELESPRRLKANSPPELSTGSLVNAQVNVFELDLRTMDKQGAPDVPWADVADYPNPARFVLRDVDLLNSGGKFYLSNERVKQVDAEYLEAKNPDSGVWEKNDSASFLALEEAIEFDQIEDLKNLTFASNNFTQVMAFYQIDQSLRYLESLGYSLFSNAVKFDGRGLSNNNSSYFMGPKAVMFGIGGSPDALDADVVLHELAHGIHYQIVPDWGYGHTGAMAEGFADYWAGSNSYRKLYEEGSDFEIDTVFNWDGYFGSKIVTRSLWNKKARYFEESEYRAHESAGGELGDELWSTPLFQTLKQGAEHYGKDAFIEVDTIVLESMYGMGRSMKMHDLAESMIYVANKLYPGRDYAALLKANFQVHGLFKAPFRVEVDSRYVDHNNPLNMRLMANGRQAFIEGLIKTSISASEALTSDKFSTLEKRIHLPNVAICGESFTLSTALAYQYNRQLQALDWTEETTLVYGVPELDQNVKIQNSVLPDATVNEHGAINHGFKSFNFIINGDSNTVDDNLALYLKISHENIADLRVTVISPKGTRQDILTHQTYSQSTLARYWIAKHDNNLSTFIGEPMAGTWRLEVTDYSPDSTGNLVEWAVAKVAQYSCTNTASNSNSNENNGAGSSSGGAMSHGLLLGLIFLCLRRKRHLYTQTEQGKK